MDNMGRETFPYIGQQYLNLTTNFLTFRFISTVNYCGQSNGADNLRT